MKKRLFVWLAASFIVIAGVGVCLCIGPTEPRYQGRTLSYWLRGYSTSSSGAARLATDKAVEQIGTNAIPTLLRLLQARDSPLKEKLARLVEKAPLIHYTNWPDWDRHHAAAEAFRVLGGKAKIAVPALIEIYNRSEPLGAQQWVPRALGNIGPEAEAAVPVLLKDADANEYIYAEILEALGEIHAHADIAVPELMKAIEHADYYPKRLAIGSLGDFKAQAKAAVPLMLRLMRQSAAEDDSRMVSRFAWALMDIDPDALKQADPKLFAETEADRRRQGSPSTEAGIGD